MATYTERGITAQQRLAEIDKEKKRDSMSLKAVLERQKKRKRIMGEAKKGVDKMSFKEAFAAKRKAGNKTFTWRGKKYTTELAKPKAATTTTKPKTNGKARTYNKGDGTTTTMQKTAKLKTLGSIVDGVRTGSRSKSLRSSAAGQKTTGMKSPQSRLIKQKERINRGKKVKINRNPKADYGAMKRGGRVRGRG